MAIFLALLCSLTWGAGDFFGGSAARRVHPFAVGWVSHTLVVAPVAIVAALVGAKSVSAQDVGWGSIGGLMGEMALLALYAGLARGPMTIVAPTTGLVAVAIPVLVGSVFQGERPSVAQWIGMGLTMAAIVLISIPDSEPGEQPGDQPDGPTSADNASMPAHHLKPTLSGFSTLTFILAVVSGIGFGMFYVALDWTSDDAGLWPLVFGRVASAGLLTALIVIVPAFRQRVLTPNLRSAVPMIATAATFDIVANGFYLFASRRGDLSIVAVISSLYPASTVVLASRFLGERLAKRQLSGMAMAVVAVALVAAG